MLDVSEFLSGSASFLLGLLRGLWWLTWDFMIQTIGWAVGWIVWRVLTLGRFPREPLGGMDRVPWFLRLIVDLTGLATLATGIWWLSGVWPRF